MATRIPANVQQLMCEQGLVPPHCSQLTVDLTANEPVTMHYTVNLTSEQFEKLALVFQVLASQGKSKQDG